MFTIYGGGTYHSFILLNLIMSISCHTDIFTPSNKEKKVRHGNKYQQYVVKTYKPYIEIQFIINHASDGSHKFL